MSFRSQGNSRVGALEWFSVCSTVGVLLYIFFYSFLCSKQAEICVHEKKLTEFDASIEINVSGAVLSPGVYKFYPGIEIRQIIKFIGLLSEMSDEDLNFKNKIYYSEDLYFSGR